VIESDSAAQDRSMSTRTRHRIPPPAAVVTIRKLESPEGIQRRQCLLADSIEPLQGGPAETYELEFHSDQGDLFPNRREERSSRVRIPERSRHRTPEAGETAMTDDEAPERTTMATFSFTSDDGELGSASAVVEVSATNEDYNQPALHVKQSGKRGGAASIRIDDPNPDIEFVENDLTNPAPGAGKFEIAVQSDRLQMNGRSGSEEKFDTIVVLQRPAAGGNIGFGFKEARDLDKFGEGQGAIVIANASAAPTVNVPGAGILYVQDGALTYRGSSGTTTVIAPA
jgi:hypothetical protein